LTKEQKIIQFIKNWLDTNIDEPTQDSIDEDSANLKEYIEHFEHGSLDIEDYITEDKACD
jgi:rhamnogalacturonyl hydrolase YesR